MFATAGGKPDHELSEDTLDNIRQTGVFCVHVVEEAATEAMNISAGIHLRDDCLVDGMFDVMQFPPFARLGYRDYSAVREAFTLKRPGE